MTSLDLSQLQANFQQSLLTRDEAIFDQIVSTESVSIKERVDIYADAYRLRLLEALSENFNGLHTLVGDAQFDKIGRGYIDYQSPNHYSIRWYGSHLAEYLRHQSPYKENPFLAEMADWDWHLLLAFDAAESSSIATQDLAAVPPEQWAELGFSFHPSMCWLDLNWNIVALREHILSDESDQNISPQRTDMPVRWLIWRRDLQQYFRSLDVDEAWAIEAAFGGANFGEICEGVCEWVDEQHAAMRAAGFLKNWVSDQLITSLNKHGNN